MKSPYALRMSPICDSRRRLNGRRHLHLTILRMACIPSCAWEAYVVSVVTTTLLAICPLVSCVSVALMYSYARYVPSSH